jgi:molybdopterin molybdotransferase
MLSLDAALDLLTQLVGPLGSEAMQLVDAHSRRLAQPVIAAIDAPRAAVSTMDGYAVRRAEVAVDAEWTIAGQSFPGEPSTFSLKAGQAVRIFTGAPMPDGADHVVIQEDVRVEGARIICTAEAGPAYVRPRASDFAAGDTILPAGTRLGPRSLVAVSAADAGVVDVFRRPRAAILATGSELVAPGTARQAPFAIPDSLSAGLAASVEAWGGICARTLHCADDREQLKRAAQYALAGTDVVIITGGASVGARDYAQAIWAELGAQPVFSKVAIKPGKPVWLSKLGDQWIIGLPGNPTSAMVTARLFLAPMLTLLSGGVAAEVLQWRAATLIGTLPPTGDRETLHRARTHAEGSVSPIGNQDSGAQATLAHADCLLRTAAGQGALPDGSRVLALDL